jgi:hypothetical protein
MIHIYHFLYKALDLGNLDHEKAYLFGTRFLAVGWVGLLCALPVWLVWHGLHL